MSIDTLSKKINDYLQYKFHEKVMSYNIDLSRMSEGTITFEYILPLDEPIMLNIETLIGIDVYLLKEGWQLVELSYERSSKRLKISVRQ